MLHSHGCMNELNVLLDGVPIYGANGVHRVHLGKSVTLRCGTLVGMAQEQVERMVKVVLTQYASVGVMCAETVIAQYPSVHAHNQGGVPG